MSSLREMAADYHLAAAKMNMRIQEKKAAGAPPEELKSLTLTLRELRENAALLSGYYECPRPEGGAAAVGWKARRTRDDR